MGPRAACMRCRRGRLACFREPSGKIGFACSLGVCPYVRACVRARALVPAFVLHIRAENKGDAGGEVARALVFERANTYADARPGGTGILMRAFEPQNRDTNGVITSLRFPRLLSWHGAMVGSRWFPAVACAYSAWPQVPPSLSLCVCKRVRVLRTDAFLSRLLHLAGISSRLVVFPVEPCLSVRYISPLFAICALSE